MENKLIAQIKKELEEKKKNKKKKRGKKLRKHEIKNPIDSSVKKENQKESVLNEEEKKFITQEFLNEIILQVKNDLGSKKTDKNKSKSKNLN